MRAHVALAAAVAGAWCTVGVPWWVASVAVVAAWGGRRRPRWAPVLLGVAVALVVSAVGAHARASLDFPAAGPFDGWATLVDDPRPSGPVGVRVTVRVGSRRMTATAHGPAAGRLDDALAGERLHLTGSVRPVAADDHSSIARHIVGRISVVEVGDRLEAAPVGRFANTVRRTLDRGAAPLDRTDRPLFLGMVIGDDREQSAVTADDFRAAGLGHLLVVSGQNVAFVLAVAMPVVGRMRPGARALALLVLLGLFAVLTRFEPSVLRATAMAGVGIGSGALGRPVDGRAGLSWACAGLLVLDPFLVHLVAFQLSAAATGGIVWFARPLADRLPGPMWLRVPVSTTAAAQLAVSPVLVAVFGPIPVASLPANVLAGPASGAVMIWGCTGGIVAGLCGGRVAEAIHLPTRLLLWWVDGIAGVAAVAPAATLGAGPLLLLGGIVLVAIAVRPGRVGGSVLALGAVAVLAVALASAPVPGSGFTPLGDGVAVIRAGGKTVLVLDDPGPPRYVLEAVRLAGAGGPALVIARDGDRADADAVVALRDRYGPVAVAAPPLHRVPGGRTVVVGQIIVVGDLRLRVDEVSPRLEYTLLGPAP